MILSILLVFGLVLVASLVKPGWILPFCWIVVLCYPQGLMFGKLPLNAGIDDIFLILAAAVTFLRFSKISNLGHARDILFLVFGLFLMQTFSELVGMIQYPHLGLSMLRNALKGLVVLLFITALVLDIRKEKDVQRHAFWMTAALTLAFGLVIACYYFPAVAGLWEVRDKDSLYMLTMASNRAFGPFNGPAEVGGVACLALPLIIGILFYSRRSVRIRFMMFISALIIFGGVVIISKSRSAILALGIMFALLLVFSRKRWYILSLGVGILLTLVSILYRNVISLAPVGERFASSAFQEGVATRLDIWSIVIRNPPHNILVGGGSEALVERIGASPHNGYLDIFYCWGLFGIFMFGCLIYCSIKWSRLVLRHDNFFLGCGIAWGLFWGLVALAFESITVDPWFMMLLRLLLFGVLVMVYSRYNQIVRSARSKPQKQEFRRSGA